MEWPSLPFAGWKETYATLHRWLQVVGKVRLALAPWMNHSWQVALYVTARGLTTSPIPYGGRVFQVDFDFIAHRLYVHLSDGRSAGLALEQQSVAQFHGAFMATLARLGIRVPIDTTPSELAERTPFESDTTHASYQREYAERFWSTLLRSHVVFTKFRTRFAGKASPVHFFWGDSDLALTFFSGRAAPRPPGKREHMPAWVLQDAYSEECCTWGFWPGSEETPYAMYFAYAYPEPAGFREARITPREARYEARLGKWVLPYDDVRRSSAPESTLLQFLQSSYDACAKLGTWEREALEYRPRAGASQSN